MKKALVQLHLAVMLWGFTGVLGRLISLDAHVLVWYRMLLTALFVWIIIIIKGQWFKVDLSGLKKLTFIGGLMAAHWITFYAAIKLTNASIALVCLSTASVFTSVLEPLLNKRKFNLQELLLGSLALVGMCLIYSFQTDFGWGILLGIIAAMLSSVFTIFNKRIANDYPVRTMVFYEMGTGFLIITALLPLFYFFVPHTLLFPQQDNVFLVFQTLPSGLFTHKNDWLWLVVLALCCTVWAQTLALNALKKLSSFTSTLSVNLEPVYGILLAIVIFREDQELSIGFVQGIVLIFCSVALQMMLLLRKATKKPN